MRLLVGSEIANYSAFRDSVGIQVIEFVQDDCGREPMNHTVFGNVVLKVKVRFYTEDCKAGAI